MTAVLVVLGVGFAAIGACGGDREGRDDAAAAETEAGETVDLRARDSSTLFADDFARPDGLLTNDYGYWNPDGIDAVRSSDWEMTSGSLFVREGAAWSGPPDDVRPDARSTNGTNSAVFRLTSRRSDFDDVAVDADLRLVGLTGTAGTPPVAWDGIHLFLRYQTQYSLYYASVDRRDGATVIKKKVPGGPSNGGTYFDLGVGVHPVPLGAWEHIRAEIETVEDGSVEIRLLVDGRLVAHAIDRGVGGPPITLPGKVGLRGDNAEFVVDNFRVSDLRGR